MKGTYGDYAIEIIPNSLLHEEYREKATVEETVGLRCSEPHDGTEQPLARSEPLCL